MENARALDDRLRKIIKEISHDTGHEIKRDLMDNLTRIVADIVADNHTRDMKNFLSSLNQAIKKI